MSIDMLDGQLKDPYQVGLKGKTSNGQMLVEKDSREEASSNLRSCLAKFNKYDE